MFSAIQFENLKKIPTEGNLLENIQAEAQKLKCFTIVQFKGKSKIPIANYKLPSQYKKLIGSRWAAYLKDFNIEPRNLDHRRFIISKIYNSWPYCAKYLKAVSLEEYFGIHSHQHDLSGLDPSSNISSFLKAEDWLLDTIVDHYQMKAGKFFPVPYEEEGKLLGVLYLIYDADQLTESEAKSLNIFQNKLIKKYSKP